MLIRRLVLSILVLWQTIPACTAAQYIVATEGRYGQRLHVSMRLVADSREKTLYSQVHGGDGFVPISDQVETPRCGARPLRKNDDGNWVAPAGCRTVTWVVRPLTVPDHSYDANLQSTARIGRAPWLVFSERTSLLRVKGESGPATIAMRKGDLPMLGGIPEASGRWRIPAADEAPEFYVIGDAPTEKVRFRGLEITYVAESLAEVHAQNLLALHARALAYLTSITFPGKALDGLDEHLLVLWLGLDSRKHMVNGAAGGRSFIANYPTRGTDGEESATKPVLVALTVTAHEQFH